MKLLNAAALRRALELRDLTDPSRGQHAMQLLVDVIEQSLGVPVRRNRAHPVVSVSENYDRLRIPAESVSRDARYTRYLSEDTILRTHATAMIPVLLDDLAREGVDDVVLSCPGIVYRRDAIDRLHVGEPHQLDLWRVGSAPRDLDDMIERVVGAALPGRHWRTVHSPHPYTLEGRQIDVADGDAWVEIGECGLAHPAVLAGAGLVAASGLAMGLGLDRILMLRKGIPDIRLLRSEDQRVSTQMQDLEPYRTVSSMPAIRRDLSVACLAMDAEELGDRVRSALEDDAGAVEEVALLSSTAYDELPVVARERLGIRQGQVNLLVRVVLRPVDRTLTDEEANRLRDRIYAGLHEGTVFSWT